MNVKAGSEPEQLMMRYLLGDLPEEEQIRLEERFFRDDQFYEQLLALEDELMYDYLQGQLPRAQRERFAKRFLASGPEQQRLEFAEALLGELSEAPAARRQPWRRVFGPLRQPALQVRFALAAAALALLVVSIALVWERNRLRSEIEEIQAGRTEEQQKLGAEGAGVTVPPQVPQSRPQASETVLTLALPPGLVRSGGQLRELILTPGVSRVRVQLNLSADDYPRYRAELLTVDGSSVWVQDRLSAVTIETGKAVHFEIPARLLTVADYEITLQGISREATTEAVADYYFRVRKQ
ncbi:MAG: hypothetical protein ACT4PM_10540 [Gemmatimonadales bacterium]